MKDEKIKKTPFRVIAEEGWNYGGKMYAMGTQFEETPDNITKLKHYFDDNTLEVVLPVKSVDTQTQAELISKTVAEVMLSVKKMPAFQSVSIHDRNNDDPSFAEKGGFSCLSEYAKAVYEKDCKVGINDTLKAWLGAEKAATGMGEVIDSEGAILAPSKFRDQLLMPDVETAVIRPRAIQVPMETNSLSVPSVEETSHASNLYGGVVCHWVDEGTAATSSKPKIGRVTLTLNKLLALAYVTAELIEDSIISLESLLPGMFQRAITYQEDEAFITGTGAGQPLGLLNSGCVVAVAKETGQAANTIETDNILNMYSRLWTPGKSRAVWLVHPDAMPQLYKLGLAVGTGGAPAGLLREQVLQGVPTTTMLGRPVIETEKCKTLGTEGDIVLTDLSQYLIGNKAGQAPGTFNSSIHLKFDQDETAFKIRLRTDGQSWWKSAVTPRNGSNTISPVVTLAVRE